MARTTFKGLIQSLYLLSMIALGSTQAPQCPNNLAVYNPNLRTVCVNGSKAARLLSVPFLRTVYCILRSPAAFIIVPVSKTTVQSAVAPYNLVPLPTSDKSLFPNGFPEGMHPVLVQVSIENDIRMTALQIPTPLLAGSITVPWVDRLGDGTTGFSFSVKQYIGGYKGSDVGGYVPGKRLSHHRTKHKGLIMHATHSPCR